MEQTKPEFSKQVSKSGFVVRPVAIEILTAVFTSLKHLMNMHNIVIVVIIIITIISLSSHLV